MNSAAHTPVVETQYVRSLMVKCGVMACAGILLAAVVLFFTIYNPAATSYKESYQLLSGLRKTILLKSILLYGFSFLLIMLGVWVIALLYSHRVAGPLYRLGMITREISAGKLVSRARLRKKDAVQPLADELNKLAEFYHRLVVEADKNIGDLTKELESVSSRDGVPGSDEEESKCAARLLAGAQAIREQFDKVRL